MGRLAEKFARAGYAVQRPALRFHDVSKPPAALGSTSLTDYAADLEEILEGLDAPPILVGHSLGGLLAQMLAARRPVKACVLLAPSAPWGVPPSTLFEIGAAQAMLLQPGFWNQILSPDSTIAGWHFLDRYPPDERDAIFKRFGPESGRATFEMMHWGLDMSRASEVDARAVKCPLLVLAGGEDRIHPPGTIKRIARSMAIWLCSSNCRHEPLADRRAGVGEGGGPGVGVVGENLISPPHHGRA